MVFVRLFDGETHVSVKVQYDDPFVLVVDHASKRIRPISDLYSCDGGTAYVIAECWRAAGEIARGQLDISIAEEDA